MLLSALDLESFQWKNRILLQFGTHPDLSRTFHPSKQALAERHLLRIEVPAGDEQRLRKQLGVRSGFAMVLIGKDGGVKARWQAPVDAEEIFGLIDSMPMRQNEMRTKR